MSHTLSHIHQKKLNSLFKKSEPAKRKTAPTNYAPTRPRARFSTRSINEPPRSSTRSEPPEEATRGYRKVPLQPDPPPVSTHHRQGVTLVSLSMSPGMVRCVRRCGPCSRCTQRLPRPRSHPTSRHRLLLPRSPASTVTAFSRTRASHPASPLPEESRISSPDRLWSGVCLSVSQLE